MALGGLGRGLGLSWGSVETFWEGGWETGWEGVSSWVELFLFSAHATVHQKIVGLEELHSAGTLLGCSAIAQALPDAWLGRWRPLGL